MTKRDGPRANLRGLFLVWGILGTLVVMQLLVGDVALDIEASGGRHFIDFRDDNIGLVEVERWRYMIALLSRYLFIAAFLGALIFGIMRWFRKEMPSLLR